MRIEEKALQHWINHFYGYGSWNARIWFVGYEDGGGELPEEVAEKFNYFYNLGVPRDPTALCDLRELYKHITSRLEGPRAELFTTLYDHRFGKQAVQHGIWKNLIAFAHGYQNKNLPDLLTYQQHSFATPASAEAWIQLYPLPSPHSHAWYYAWLDMPTAPFLKSRAKYQDHMYNDRIAHLLQKIKEHKPKVVLMYGMENINMLKDSVITIFSDATFKSVKAIKLHIPQHHIANVNGTILIITTQMPALHHNRVETGFDWYAFGKQVARP